jgi:hypothetical protein
MNVYSRYNLKKDVEKPKLIPGVYAPDMYKPYFENVKFLGKNSI